MDAQDPLPEPQWLWRRVYVFATTTGLALAIYYFAWLLAHATTADQTRAFFTLTKWTLALLWTIMTYYLIAPSAEQIVKMFQTASVLRAGVAVTTSNTATAPDGGTATSTTEVKPGGDTGQAPKGADEPSAQTGLPEKPTE